MGSKFVGKPQGQTPLFATEYLRGAPTLTAGDLGGRITFFAVDNLQRFRLETACG